MRRMLSVVIVSLMASAVPVGSLAAPPSASLTAALELADGLADARAEARARLSDRRADAEHLLATVAARAAEGGPTAALEAAALPMRLDAVADVAETPIAADPVAALAAAVADAEALLRREGVTDRAALIRAALDITATIERALPALQAGRALGSGAAPCDVADAGPVCVAGSGAGTHTADKALIVDLGGDDTYNNSAGGADVTRNSLPVSVVVDVGGNDRYETAIPSHGGARAVQGGAFSGGIGILVDAAGRDTYRAVSSQSGVSALGQGMGSSGIGLLADLAGDDSFALEERTPGVTISQTQRMTAAGQGFGELGGLGVMLDVQGDDMATVRSAPSETPTTATRYSGGFGAGEQGGVGLHADLDGDDRFLLEARDGTSATTYGASVRGFGYGFEGSGFDIGGRGDAERIARVQNDVVDQEADSAALFALGAASLGGFGALHDPAGSDTYVADFLTRSVSEHVVDDACGCLGASAASRAPGGQSLALGAGQQGVALLDDGGGNDTYLMSSRTVARAIARDDRTQMPQEFMAPVAEARTTVAGGGFAPAGGQVVSHAVGISNGLGVLADAGGNDAYAIDLVAESIAEVFGPHHLPSRENDAEMPGPTAQALGAELDVYMQGVGQLGGLGALEDAGGDDAYQIDLRMEMRSLVHDRRDDGSSSAYPLTSNALMSNGYHDVYGQGIGVIGGAGFVHDRLGDDSYDIDHRLHSQADAMSDRPEVEIVADAVPGLFARVEAMGAGGLGGYGELQDAGGTDRYACRARSTALLVDVPTDGSGECQVLGGGVAFGFFADLDGGADVVSIEPPFPTTGGTRGQGVWYGPGGAGINT